MKLHLQTASDTYLFTAYGAGYVAINGVRHAQDLILLPKQVIAPWQAAEPEILTESHFSMLEELELEVLLLGTGARLRFPPPQLLHAMAKRGIGLEAMDTFAACRTYNILAGEDRKVAAALILA